MSSPDKPFNTRKVASRRTAIVFGVALIVGLAFVVLGLRPFALPLLALTTMVYALVRWTLSRRRHIA
jgi:hypothetical protein